jgi:hypothetical protein
MCSLHKLLLLELPHRTGCDEWGMQHARRPGYSEDFRGFPQSLQQSSVTVPLIKP